MDNRPVGGVVDDLSVDAAKQQCARGERRQVDGLLLLDKPVGLSSNQALQRVKGIYRARKAGHTGTLDPLASGVLPICLGEATKLATFLLDTSKSYLFRVKFGTRTSTGDCEGAVVETGPDTVGKNALEAAVEGLMGPIEQTPPMFSAVRHHGRPLYELARAGSTVERTPRPVRIDNFEVVEFDPTEPLLMTRCSKGTYIRVLAEDLAVVLGTVGHVTELRRLSAGAFDLSQCVRLEELAQKQGEALRPADEIVADYARADLSASDASALMHGRAVHVRLVLPEVGPVRLYGPDGRFFGMGTYEPDGALRPRRLLSTV